jgi:hypothetical protein
MKKKILIGLIITIVLLGTWYFLKRSFGEDKKGEEQISIGSTTSMDSSEPTDSVLNSVTGNVTMKQIATFPNKVILTGLDDQRLVSIYKSKSTSDNGSSSSLEYYSEESEDEANLHFMPGIDILFGYNLLNIAHYDLKTEKVNYLFSHPVLIKTLYYPSYYQDSLYNKPITRNFYLVSAYDEDTNKDTLINKKDLRHFYHFDAKTCQRTQLVPKDYSVIRSQYDYSNDIMYVFASHDENKNGTQDKVEPVHIFWISLKTPDKAKLLY